MKITSIKQQVKNQERASIFVDGSYSFSLSLNELVAEKLKINQELSDSDLKRLKKLSEDGKLKSKSLEWVMSRPRSVREFKDYLYRHKAEAEQSDSLVEEFLSRKYLDETRYAAWLIDMRKRGGKSNRAIQNELTKRGIDRDIIAQSLPKDSDEETERLKVVIHKKLRIARYRTDEDKLKQLLLRQGFIYQDIKIALADINSHQD